MRLTECVECREVIRRTTSVWKIAKEWSGDTEVEGVSRDLGHWSFCTFKCLKPWINKQE